MPTWLTSTMSDIKSKVCSRQSVVIVDIFKVDLIEPKNLFGGIFVSRKICKEETYKRFQLVNSSKKVKFLLCVLWKTDLL